METNTLINVVAHIKSVHEATCRTENILDKYQEGYLDALENLMDYFQDAIDLNIAAMETSMGM
jgi:hypothetical protein